jgi:hypothetical protein
MKPMNPRITAVKPLKGHQLELHFTDGQVRLFDMRPYLGIGIFAELNDLAVFNTATAALGTVTWANGADLCPDTLYEGSSTPERAAR